MNVAYKLNNIPQQNDTNNNLILVDFNAKKNKDGLVYMPACELDIDVSYKLDNDAADEDDIYIKEGKIPVQPLIGEEIKQAIFYLMNKPERYQGNTLKNCTLFCLGISIGLRISDLLDLKISDVVKNGEIKNSTIIEEQKTKNKREIFFRPSVKRMLLGYINSIEDWKYNYYLFHPRNNYYKKMGRRNVNTIMKDIEKALCLDFPLGTHSLRKTFARAIFDLMMSKGDIMAIEKLQDILGHKDVSTTRRYIGLQREGKRDIYLDENFMTFLNF